MGLSFQIQRDAGNPVITLPQGAEVKSQYVPHAVQLPNGDIWLVVKGDILQNITAYKSTDGGRTFTKMGALIDPTPNTWDRGACLDPVVIYDPAADVLHYYYKGNMTVGYGGWAIGHATAPGSNPMDVTKDPLNPILTSATVLTYLQTYVPSLGLTQIQDLYVSDLIKGPDNVLTWFGGFYGQAGTPYRICRFKSTTWNNPAPYTELVSPSGTYPFVQCPTVFRYPGSSLYVMWLTEGYDGSNDDYRHLTAAWSTDCANWTRYPGSIVLGPGAQGCLDSRKVFAASLMKGGPKYDTPVTIDGSWRLFYSGAALAETYPKVRTFAADVRPISIVTL